MASMTLKTAAAVAFVLSQPALAAIFPLSIANRSEIEAIPLEKRGAMAAYQMWAGAEIPYILEKLPHDLSESIRGAMRQWEQSTCIRFLPKKDQGAWVNFKKYDEGCYAQGLGSPGIGERIVNLDYPDIWEKIGALGTYKACMEAGTPGHELGHVIGLAHEQQRPDRDQYIRILTDRIQEDFLDQFTIDSDADTSVPFDYNSIMLYDTKAFAKTNRFTWLTGEGGLKHTMETITDKQINPWSSPTANDFKAVNDAYKCEEYYTRTIPECLAGAIPANTDFSSYTFILDSYTEKYMRENGYTHVAAHQNCRANTLNQDTDNWGFTPLNGWGPRSPYKVTTNRCKKDFDRHASRYEVALCKGDNEGACDIKCGLRRVCPYDGNNKQVDSKAIDVVDNNLWVCHPH
ncbi:Zinc metalloproteinase nas-5 [Colletotrichum truncatum]|uniref:Zinc metalloproteinase nas-5 n=1 Tax=Colletotrichum truncatum TaxID=5467 RepID=A0ACC3YWU3_COLTU|nr:Zinc metalloproteinase nas-5 [Colletotrichum truncatum]KAF6781512.1 Zinc metalloproteinase nas-5 [Colletotrichum truncatum]